MSTQRHAGQDGWNVKADNDAVWQHAKMSCIAWQIMLYNPGNQLVAPVPEQSEATLQGNALLIVQVQSRSSFWGQG